MTADEWIRLVQVIVAALPAVGQKLRSDNRAEWYRRYAQATEWSLWQEFAAKAIGWLNLPEPGDSELIMHRGTGERGPAQRHRRAADHAEEAVVAAAEGVVKATR